MSKIQEAQLIRDYKVIRILGKGSFGKVYLMRNEATSRQLFIIDEQFAMKKYSKYYIAVNGKESSILRSARILSNLQHPNIIKLRKFCDSSDDPLYLIYEPCKKGSLQDIKKMIIKTKDQKVMVFILFQIVEALRYLKSMSVAHRDIKPSNLAFTSEGILKVIDFDEAVCFNQAQQFNKFKFDFSEQTEQNIKMIYRRSFAHSFVGTDKYMSPQMKFTTKTDERGDTWAFGCILYQLVINDSFQLNYDEEQGLQIQLQAKIDKLRKSSVIDPDCYHLLISILKSDPAERIGIQDIYMHDFFNGIRENKEIKEQCRLRFERMLRSNSSLVRPNIAEALQYDLIGFQSGPQRFQLLNTVIFLINELDQLYFIRGGPRYFKLTNVQQPQKYIYNNGSIIYIYYFSINSIKRQNKSILIQTGQQKWGSQIIFASKYQIKVNFYQ